MQEEIIGWAGPVAKEFSSPPGCEQLDDRKTVSLMSISLVPDKQHIPNKCIVLLSIIKYILGFYLYFRVFFSLIILSNLM